MRTFVVMKPTIQYIQQKVDEFNRQMFDGKLPPVPVSLSNAKTYLGLCVYKRRRKFFGGVEKYDFHLRFSTRIDLPENEVEDTIIHELIHYYIGVNNLKDSSAHGKLFRSIMCSINKRFGRHLTISHKCTSEQREQAVDKRRKLHAIAFVRFLDGRCGVKVLPRMASHILRYYNGIRRSPEIKQIELYMSSNPFFNRYPSSSALRIHYIDEQLMLDNLQDAERLVCDGKSVKFF